MSPFFSNQVYMLRVFLFFFHSVATLITSFLPIYFQASSLDGTQIGILMAVGPFVSILSQPFWGYLSDKLSTVKYILLFCLFCLFIGTVVLFQTDTFYILIGSTALFFFFMSPIGGLSDSLAVKTAHKEGISFGSIRTFGSLGFAITALIGGEILQLAGVETLVYLLLGYILIAMLFSMKISDVKQVKTPLTLLSASKQLGIPTFWLFLLVVTLVTIPHRTNDTYLGIYVKALGGDESFIGWAWFIAVLSEALVYATSHLWMHRLSELTWILGASLLFSLRWILLSFLSDPLHLIALQCLHGVTFGVFYICAFQFITKLVPAHLQGSGHLLFITVFFGLSGMIGSLGGGFVIETFSPSVLYFIMGLSSVIGSIAIVLFRRYASVRQSTIGRSTSI
ncbi:MFS transporter [Aureibacillus halotolerans]|uniref:Major facilitator superfamily (MFS) profile domain-containing protein n=1 Tax=Aureibacillus halotolerans TaxID=1508390 RepID=A0A4R6U766_9BACI|nr:MFS transporter [Aureibacillus halotolerans]TDQ42171.1 PPP family 3-phenylpropionic acid transporter/hypothetical protein [Aureibacillus halotolerans]